MARLAQIGPMPPTPQNLMRRANTSRIARSLSSGALPTAPSTDPFTPPIQSRLVPPLTMPPTVQPPQTDPFTPAPPTNANFPWITYESLMRSAGRPVTKYTPMAGELGGGNEHTDPMPPGQESLTSEPGLPGDPGLPDPNTNPAPIGSGGTTTNPIPLPEPGVEPTPIPGPHPELGLDPGGVNYPGGGGDYDPASGIGNSPPPRGNYFPTFGGGPYQPIGGGRLGSGHITGGRESVPGMLLRRLPLPYGANLIPGLYHTIAERIRAGQRGQGRPGAPARQVRGSSPQPVRTSNTTPSGRIPGTRSPVQYWDYGAGQLRTLHDINSTAGRDRDSVGAGSRAANASLMARMAAHDPTNFSGGQRSQSDAGISQIVYGNNSAMANRRARINNGVIEFEDNNAVIDPAMAARLRAHAAAQGNLAHLAMTGVSGSFAHRGGRGG